MILDGSINNETVMDCIQNYPLIYDKGNSDYKNKIKKKNAWKEVASALYYIDVLEAQTRYQSIRTNTYIKKLGSVGTG